MMTINIFRNHFYLLFFVLFTSCKAETKQQKNTTSTLLKTTLENQLKYGSSGVVDNDFDVETYTYSETDLDAIIPIETQILNTNGYHTPNRTEFQKKIKEIFKIELNKNSKYSTITPLCTTEVFYYRNDDYIKNLPDVNYVITKHKFITELYAIPEIYSYKIKEPTLSDQEKKYPNYIINNAEENVKIIKWKDIDDLDLKRNNNEQKLINRNLFLFNSNKSAFNWLIKFDQKFIKNLLIEYGWTGNNELIKWVVNTIIVEKFNPSIFSKLFYYKKCNSNLQINYNVLNYLKEGTSFNRKKLLINLRKLVEYMSNFENTIDNLTQKERLEIVANIATTYKQLNTDENDYTFGILRYYFNENINMLRENNYFNNKAFKAYWENSDYEYYYYYGKMEGVWGNCIRPLEKKDWQKNGKKLNSYINICKE